MRLKERGMTEVCLVKRIAAADSLGGRPEAFSQERTPFKASILPEGGEMEVSQRGLKSGERLRILSGRGIDVKTGDGIWAEDRFYVVRAVKRWSAHLELICEARA